MRKGFISVFHPLNSQIQDSLSPNYVPFSLDRDVLDILMFTIENSADVCSTIF